MGSSMPGTHQPFRWWSKGGWNG